MKKLDEVARYWNKYIVDTEVTDKKRGSREFFEELEKYRYWKLSYLKCTIEFHKYTGKSVLEVGCGLGFDLLQFAKNGAKVTGVDLASNAIDLAKKYFALNNFKADLYVGNAEKLDFQDDHFDIVYSFGVLHHTPNTQVAVNNIHRVLKPGGKAIVMLYNKLSWLNLLTIISGVNIEHTYEEAPIVKKYLIHEAKKMFYKFSSIRVTTERFPVKTLKYKNILGKLYNGIFVPIFDVIPKFLIKPFGWHIIIWAIK